MNEPIATSKAPLPVGPSPKHVAHHPQVVRETLESLAVAFILALMFKAFIAEAFVIPTGSMAPTLMGAHKDIACDECGFQYQCGASSEYTDTGAKSGRLIFGTVCPLCRKPQILDLLGNANHRTFTGDRILVSKLAYVFSRPERWQVFVFKHVEDARLNYIKRCLGVPNETLRIERGDVYVKKASDNPSAPKDVKDAVVTDGDTFEIARKPPHVIRAMLQPLSDTAYPAPSLIKAGVPDAWQPGPDTQPGAWTIESTDKRWSAKVTGVPASQSASLRYRHRVIDPFQWESLTATQKLPKPISPDAYRLVTDFTAYNSGLSFGYEMKAIPANYADIVGAELRKAIHKVNRETDYVPSLENDGLHWTGDLSGEWEIATESATEAIQLLLVEAGVEHRCEIDLKTGEATAKLVFEGNELQAFEDGKGGWTNAIKASTRLRAGSKHRVQFANVDDALTLWIDGTPVAWGNQGRFSIQQAIPGFTHTPRTSKTDPLDAAPLGVGVRGGGCSITHAKVARDIYYIAHSIRDTLTDYTNALGYLQESSPKSLVSSYLADYHTLSEREYVTGSNTESLCRNALFSNIDAWSGSLMDKQRRNVTFAMGDDAYFPLGDNSSASADARSWREHHVPERLLIGRAVLVFWPHYWNAPIPFMPDFERMGLIR